MNGTLRLSCLSPPLPVCPVLLLLLPSSLSPSVSCLSCLCLSLPLNFISVLFSLSLCLSPCLSSLSLCHGRKASHWLGEREWYRELPKQWDCHCAPFLGLALILGHQHSVDRDAPTSFLHSWCLAVEVLKKEDIFFTHFFTF